MLREAEGVTRDCGAPLPGKNLSQQVQKLPTSKPDKALDRMNSGGLSTHREKVKA